MYVPVENIVVCSGNNFFDEARYGFRFSVFGSLLVVDLVDSSMYEVQYLFCLCGG